MILPMMKSFPESETILDGKNAVTRTSPCCSHTRTPQQKRFVFCTSMKRQDIPSSTTHLMIQSSNGGSIGLTIIPEEWMELINAATTTTVNGQNQPYSSYWRHHSKWHSLLLLSQTLDGCFFGCNSKLEHAGFYEGLQRVGPFAFVACTFLESVSIPSTLVSIDQYAFAYCSYLIDIELPEGLQVIDDWAFYECQSLEHAAIPSTVTIIGKHCFHSCYALMDVEFLQGLVEIEEYAFWKCKSLCAVSIPSSTFLLGKCAFADCRSLLGVEFAADTTSLELGRSCFAGCTSLINMSLPVTTAIGSLAFVECPFKPKDFYERFANLPIHKACYHSSSLSIEALKTQTAALTSDEYHMTDNLGMTPFHLIATSASFQPDLLQILLDQYPIRILEQKDKQDKTMLDYLLQNESTKAIPLIQLILKRTVMEIASKWGLDQCNRFQDLVQQVKDCELWDTHAPARRKILDDILEQLVTSTKIEAASILELALWKTQLSSSSAGQDLDSKPTADRGICRVVCGADVVLPNVIDFLWNNNPEPSPQEEYLILPPEISWLQGEIESDDDWDTIW